MLSPSDIQVIVPAYNCEQTIANVISGIREQGLEVTVVDDGSHDKTAAIAAQAGALVLRHSSNRGKGYALRTGFSWSLSQQKAAVLTLDADGQHDPADIPLFLARSAQEDLLIGQRQLKPSAMPIQSFVGNSISTFFISLFCGAHFFDTQCGFRLYSTQLLQQIPLRGGRFETETDILIRASRLGMNIGWVPIKTIYKEGIAARQSYFHNTYDTLRVISVVLQSLSYPKEQKR